MKQTITINVLTVNDTLKQADLGFFFLNISVTSILVSVLLMALNS